jgi:hypothetical protein
MIDKVLKKVLVQIGNLSDKEGVSLTEGILIYPVMGILECWVVVYPEGLCHAVYKDGYYVATLTIPKQMMGSWDTLLKIEPSAELAILMEALNVLEVGITNEAILNEQINKLMNKE